MYTTVPLGVPAREFKVGDRVKVTLTIIADKDMSYVVVNDKRAAGLEPKEQLPTPVYSDGLCFYRENRDSHTNLFIDFLPKEPICSSMNCLLPGRSFLFGCGTDPEPV